MTTSDTIEPTERPVVLLTMRVICERLSVSRSTVYELIAKGDLVPIHVAGSSRCVRFRESDIEDLIHLWAQQPTTLPPSRRAYANRRTSTKPGSLSANHHTPRTEWPRL